MNYKEEMLLDELLHTANKPRSKHKYIKREFKNGKWIYTYAKETVNDMTDSVQKKAELKRNQLRKQLNKKISDVKTERALDKKYKNHIHYYKKLKNSDGSTEYLLYPNGKPKSVSKKEYNTFKNYITKKEKKYEQIQKKVESMLGIGHDVEYTGDKKKKSKTIGHNTKVSVRPINKNRR